MSQVTSQGCSGGSDGQAIHRNAGAFCAADALALAASPTFALMGLLTAILGGGPLELFCSAAHGSSLGGMVTMYLLMSAFHATPWLRLMNTHLKQLAV